MLSTGDIRDWDAVVDQVLRCLVLKASVDRRRQLELHTLRDIEPMQVSQDRNVKRLGWDTWMRRRSAARPRNRSSRTKRSIRGNLCPTRSINSTFAESFDSARLGSTLVNCDRLDRLDRYTGPPTGIVLPTRQSRCPGGVTRAL